MAVEEWSVVSPEGLRSNCDWNRDRARPTVLGMPTAIITGASRGLGLALARALAQRGWALILDARGPAELERVARGWAPHRNRRDPRRRRRRRIAARSSKRPATESTCSSTTPACSAETTARACPVSDRRARARLSRSTRWHRSRSLQLVLPRLRDGGRIINVTSDAAVEPYEGWGGYGSSKAALEQVSAILAAERPALRVYAVTPVTCARGCTRRRFPARTSPIGRRRRTVVPGLLTLIEGATCRAGDTELATFPYRRWSLDRLRVRRPRSPRGARAARGAWHAPRRGQAARGPAFRRVGLTSALRRSGRRARSGRSAGRQRLGDDAGGGVRRSPDGERITVHFASPAPQLADGWWVVELRSADGGAPAPCSPWASGSTLEGGAELGLVAPYASGGAAGAGAVRGRRLGHRLSGAPRQADPLRLRAEPWPLDAYQNVYATARQRRDGKRRQAVYPRADHQADRPRRGCRADHAALRRVLARSATKPRCRSASRCPSRPRR